MDGRALEVALALWRMPSMRAALRQRPLPEDVGGLIELAPGAPERVAAATAGTDVTGEQLLEAVRFYIREVLMFDGADAYRVLGVAHDAAPRQIKAHHRALQHWLHPDRRGDEWESIYATRINTAWAELRTPQRRAAYDARHATPGLADVATQHRVLVNDWRAVRGQQTQTQWFGWVGLGLAVALCLCLVVLADRQARMPAPQWVTDPVPPVGPENRSRFASLVDRVTAMPLAVDTAAEVLASPEVVRRTAAILPPATVTPLPATRSGPDDALPAAPALSTSGLPQAQIAAETSPGLVAQDKAPAPLHAQPRATPQRQTAIPVAPSQPAAASRLAVAHTTPASSTAGTDPLVERVHLAYQRGDEITRYLAGPADRAPPIWRSAVAFDAAASLREQLASGRSRIARGRNPVRFGDPVWRIAAVHASMISSIQRSGTRSSPGTLHVELAWRDGMWLVDSIEAKNLEAEKLP